MKIKVKLEGREDVYLADRKSLKAWIKFKKFKKIHNFIGGSGMVIGADHRVKDVLEDIDNAERLAVFTDPNANIGHSLALILNNKLEMYDIGTLTKKDLEITNK